MQPLVAQFRVRGLTREHAFTFTLVNIHIDRQRPIDEIDVLADINRVVHHASGVRTTSSFSVDFNVDDRTLVDSARLGIYPVIQSQATNTLQTDQLDNIILHRPSTVEFTGRGGVLDLMRRTTYHRKGPRHLRPFAGLGRIQFAGKSLQMEAAWRPGRMRPTVRSNAGVDGGKHPL